ncbi:MAG: peptide deformylase [Clostridiales bacterium]|jgi:peptide deformylase|nr:peptide deformylase [Clostridiales bacterium]
MAIREILKIGDEALRKVSRPVTEFDARLGALLDDLLQTMRAADGVGIAAPQVGILRRAIIVDDGESGPIELVNPVIVKRSGSIRDAEGCLSVPNRRGFVTRPKTIKVTYFDRAGTPMLMKTTGILARIVCHETDHLDGVLFVDKQDADAQ